jgi:hypothetical protein
MPRPRLLAEADRIRAWTIAHPKTIVVPERSPMPDSARLVRGILASGGAMVFLASIYEYFALAGVADSMPAARIVLILAGVAAFAGILVSEFLWGKSRKAMIVAAITAAVGLVVGLWGLDSWTVRYRVAHTQPTTTASEVRDFPPSVTERPMTPQEQQIAGTLISKHLKEHPGERIPLDWMNQQLLIKKQNFQMRHMPPIADDVVVDGAGSTQVSVNGLFYMRNGDVSNGKVGIENNGGQVHLDGTNVHDNEKNIINNAQPKESGGTTRPPLK